MTTPLGAGLTWQQVLALGLVAAFVGAARILDHLHQSAVVPPSEARSGSDPMRAERPRGTRSLE